MTLLGIKGYVYGGFSTVFKAGDPSSDKQIPLNPLLKFDSPIIRYIQEKMTTCDKLDPNIIYDLKLEEGSVTLSGLFRDPFWLLMFTTYNTLPTVWSGTGDTITGAFTSEANKTKNIWIQVHIEDDAGSSHINLLFDGGEITNYKWIIEEGKPLIEEVTIKFVEITANTEAVNIDNGFDDGSFDRAGQNGGWALWDPAYILGTVAHSKDCTITWNNAAVPGMGIQKCVLDFATPKERYWVQSSLIASGSFSNKRDSPLVTITGVITGGQALTEYLAAYSSKNRYTLKVLYGTTKFLQITNMYHEGFDGIGLPEAGKSIKGEYVFSGGVSAVSYSWTADEADDPGDFINHTNV